LKMVWLNMAWATNTEQEHGHLLTKTGSHSRSAQVPS